ncbi:MAG: hypothetical protein ACOCP2_04310, partial [Halohasta sp.]
DAVEHGSTSPDSQARQDAGRASSSEPSVADAPEDAVEHGSKRADSQRQQRKDNSAPVPDSDDTQEPATRGSASGMGTPQQPDGPGDGMATPETADSLVRGLDGS